MKLLEKFYNMLIFIVLALFFYIIRIDANENITLLAISLIIGSIFVASLPFLLNKCKKIQVRKFYLISMCATSLFTMYKGIYLLIIKFIIKDDSIGQIFSVYISAILQAIFISFTILTIIYSFKDLFKKDYEFSKLDLQSFQMSLNVLTYGLIILLAFEYSGFKPIPTFNPINFNIEKIVFELNNNTFITGMIIICVSYILITTIINFITYYKFDKNK